MEDVRSGGENCDGSSLCLATPPSTPTTTQSSNLGPRKNSMSSSIASLSSTMTVGSSVGCSTVMGSTSTLQEAAAATSSSALSSPCHSESIVIPSRPESSQYSMTDTISLTGSIRLSTMSSN